MKKSEFKNIFILVLVIIGVIWLISIIGFIFPVIKTYGIIPWTIRGLTGILICPFVHVNFGHLISNTIPLAVFLFLLFLFYRKVSLWVIILSVLIGGLLVWLQPFREGVHIGASGLVYALAAFIITSGIIIRKIIPLLISIGIIIIYGGLIWGMMPGIAGTNISWEGHLFGAVAGVGLAFLFKPRGKNKKETY